ncbi:MAG: ADP-ribosyl-(dinitrogen reductase) hydrolase [Paenibacillaceae bacterium]|jgi:ADP-ribosyl-[dinitrogen reductase] hydrolase|nr:ADP-ribosyl-(dinitrogen reductase) hydrolase [Paenibacillaceae bacterium]
MNGEQILDKIKGGLYGVAVGDALGGTTEFMTRQEIKARYGYLTEVIGGGVWGLEPGEVTDDTMMTLCVAEGIVENPAQPVEAIGRRFLEWYRSRPKDIGNIIRHTMEHYRDNWFEAAFLTDLDLGQSGGNGSLMRCLPAALAYADSALMETVSRMQSRMTHYDERCDEACVIYNKIARRLLAGEELSRAIPGETAGTAYSSSFTVAPDCPPDGYVVHTFHWVLYILMNTEQFEGAVQYAANLGGDSDTIGAIAGGLAGIHYGYRGIPSRYRDCILVKERLERTAELLIAVREGTLGGLNSGEYGKPPM